MNDSGSNSKEKGEIFCLNEEYSTTMMVTKQRPVIQNSLKDMFETRLFLLPEEGAARNVEGGLRKRGYFKHSYEILDGQWFVRNNTKINNDDLKQIQFTASKKVLNLFESVRNELLDRSQAIKEDWSEYRTCFKKDIINRLLSNRSTRTDVKAKLLDSISIEKYFNTINRIKKQRNSINFSQYRLQIPLITIITVVLNGVNHIDKTIQSVLNQNYPNVEYIVIDGGSTDGTLDIINKYQDQIDYWISQEDNGIYQAMNKGITLALGRYVGILNSGDNYTPKTFLKVFNIAHKKKIDCISGAIKVIDNTKSWYVYPSRLLNTKNILSTPFPHPSFFVSSYLYKQIGMFDENLHISGDHDFMIRCIKHDTIIGISNIIFTEYPRIGKAHFTPDSLKFKEKEYIRKKNSLGFIFFIYNLLLFLKNKLKNND